MPKKQIVPRDAPAMDKKHLLAEIRRVKSLLAAAAKRAAVQYVLIDKLTAASLRVQALLKALRAGHGRRRSTPPVISSSRPPAPPPRP